MCNILVIGSKDGFLCLQHIRKEHTRDIVLFFSVVIASVTIVTAVLYWKNPSYVIDDFSNGDTDEQENNTPVDYLPGFLYLRHIRKEHTRDIVLFFSVVIVSVTIMTAVLYWKHPSYDISNGETDKQENNTSVHCLSDCNTTNGKELRILPRPRWSAQLPIERPPSLTTPVPLVVIHHTTTLNCKMQCECKYLVGNIQQYHIEGKQRRDIEYNFLIGGDGAVYEGRGWTQEGALSIGYNNKSLGVAFIGTFSSQAPPKDQIVVFNRLIARGVELGYIKKNHKILGARQLFDTDSPGRMFYEEIQKWPHWSEEVPIGEMN